MKESEGGQQFGGCGIGKALRKGFVQVADDEEEGGFSEL